MNTELPQRTDTTGAEEKLSAEAKPVPNWKQRVRRLLWPLHARFPSIIPNPIYSDKDYYCERDAEDNVKTALDKDVSLKLGCILVSEVFGPKEIEALHDGLKNIGWDRERMLGGEDSNVDWLKEQRLYGTEGTMPLGWVHRPEDLKKYVGIRYTAQFPKEFSSLLVNIAQLTPSVTCLSVGFILTEESSLEYANEINRAAQTTVVPKRRHRPYSIMSVAHVKEKRVRRVRQKYRNLGILWLSKSFPGFFSENCENRNFPTAEFLLLEGFTPFDEEAHRNRGWQHWSRFVNIDYDFGSWTCASVPSLKFSFDSGYRNKNPNHMTIALRWDTLSDDDTKFYGSDSIGSRTYFANDRLNGIISRYALASYLRELLRSLKETRQSLTVRSKVRHSSIEVEKISEFFRRSVGVPSIAREVLALSENDVSFRWNSMGFNRKMRPDKESTYDIKEGLKSILRRLSQQLLEEDQDTREYLNQLSSAIGTKESIAAQRRMEVITRAALVVSLISLVVAALAAL